MIRNVIMVIILFLIPLFMIPGGAQQEAKEATAAPVTLTFLRSGGSGEEKVVGPVAEESAKEIGISVEMVMVPWGQAFDKIMTMVAGNNAPDVAYIGSRWIPHFAEIGAITPIDVPAERKEEYFNSIWPMVTWEGKIYGIPRAFSTKVLYYNTRLFKQAGLSKPPQTWSELEAAAKTITENTDAYGFALAGEKFVSTTSQFFNLLFQNGGDVFDEQGNVIINNENGIEALKFYVNLAKYAEEGPTAWRREELWELFAEGKVGMYVSGPWRVGAFKGKVPFATAALPAGPRGSSASILVSDSLVVFKQSSNPDLAEKFALSLTSYERQKILDTEWGMTPMRKEETELEFFQTPEWKTFVDMIPRGKPQPLVKNWELLEDAVTDMIQFALLNKLTPEEALDWAASKLEELK